MSTPLMFIKVRVIQVSDQLTQTFSSVEQVACSSMSVEQVACSSMSVEQVAWSSKSVLGAQFGLLNSQYT